MTLHVLFTGLVSKEYISGGDQLFLDIIHFLPKNLKIVVVTPEFAKGHWTKIKKSNLEFRYLPKNRFDFNHFPLFIFLSYLVRSIQVYNILKKEKDLEILYSCSDVAYADIWPAYYCKLNKPKISWVSRIYHVILPPSSRQGSFLTNALAFYLQRLSFWMIKKQSDPILALNEKLKNELLNLGFPQERLGVLGAGVDYEKINSFKPAKKYPYDAVVLGRLAPVKGIFDMVKIWKVVSFSNPSFQLAWIGGSSDDYRKKVVEAITNEGLGDSFHLLGYLDKEEVYGILKSAKVFLCPDHENGWGLAVSEAMSAGLPVVSYNLDIFGGVYKKGYVSVPLFDTALFAREVVRVLTDNNLRQELSMQARLQAAKFDNKQVVYNLLNFIKFPPKQVSKN